MIAGFLLLCGLTCLLANQAGSSCCHEASRGGPDCRDACDQLSLDSGPGEQLQQLSHVAQTCPHHLIGFWQCINNTFAAVSNTERWSGRDCCEQSWSTQCQNSCQRARSRDDIADVCRPTDELAFFSCLDRQEVSATCCGPATSSQCRAVCKAIFIADSLPSRAQKKAVREHCSPQVASCVHNYTQMTPARNPAESMPCCDHSTEEGCRSRCREVLTTMDGEKEIVEEIITACGVPAIEDPMWQCFLQKSGNVRQRQYQSRGTIETTGIDGAKLLCCSKAQTSRCRLLCVKTYSRSWANSWTNFYEECAFHASESDLNLCLQEVDEPCELGCSGLDYCTNFNNRPTQLFRRCSSEADAAAQQDIFLWEKGVIQLPLLEDIPVKDVTRCQPEMWKTIACTQELKPCHSRTHTTNICKSDCKKILSECVDWMRLPLDRTPESLCNMLSAVDDNQPCISLSQFTVASPHQWTHHEVTNPCRPNPCSTHQVCIINRRKCKHKNNCRPYVCKPGCPMGEVSKYLVPRNAYVRIPVAERQINCFRVCKCGHHGLLSSCIDVGCKRMDSCILSSGGIQAHGSQFMLGCKQCSCHSGEVVCTEKKCLHLRASMDDKQRYTGLPCNCGQQFEPMCGSNGRTYPNQCLAQCAGLKQGQALPGHCSDLDPCVGHPCGSGFECVPRRQVCLSNTHSCLQYECIALNEECNTHHHDPACDTRGEEFTNMCILLQRGRKLKHRGHCLNGCQITGPVCGTNGETHISECAAWAAGTPVDYTGKCRAVGVQRRGGGDPDCTSVKCLHKPYLKCHTITPPGACCPVCGGEIRLLYSRREVDSISSDAGLPPLSVSNITEVLKQHVSVAECSVLGYLSTETDLVILVMPLSDSPTQLQIQACITEAEKLGSLLEQGSPILASHVAMTPILTASVRTAKPGNPSAASTETLNVYYVILLTMTFMVHTCTWYLDR